MLNLILWVLLGFILLYPVLAALTAGGENTEDPMIIAVASAAMGVILITLLYLVRRGQLRLISTLLVLALLAGVTFSVSSYGGIYTVTISGFFLAVILAGILLGAWAALHVGLLSALILSAIFYAQLNGRISFTRGAPHPFELFMLLSLLSMATLMLYYAVRSMNRAFESARSSARELAETNRELEESRAAMELYTHELERRSRYQAASAEVGRAVSALQDPHQLISRVVQVIRQAFDLYYVGLFTLDESGEWAVLQAGTGEAGRKMLARRHRIRVGSGMIGWAIQQRQARVAHDVGEDAVRLATAELPDTRSELALPMRSGTRVIGALTVQSTQPAAFDEDTIAVLQSMADQVAVALDNARLYTEAQNALQAARRAYGELSRRAWSDILRAEGEKGYRYVGRSVTPAEGDWKPEMQEAVRSGESVERNTTDQSTLAIPIKIRDQVIGALSFRKDAPDEGWTTSEKELLEILTEQVEVALESARLFEETQNRAAHERLIGEIAARLRASTSIETVLQTTLRELGQLLGASGTIRMIPTGEGNGQEQTEPRGRRE
jgi:GAF domain-containing protein